MVAPIGNQFWKHASKHGRKKLFESPQLMKEAAEEYFLWAENTPLLQDNIELVKVNGVGDEVRREPLKVMRAFTMHGLCRYLGCSTVYFSNFKLRLRDGDDPQKEEFLEIIAYIEETVYERNFTGAAGNFLNANLISRALGLIDRKDLTTNGESFVPPTIIVEPMEGANDYEDLL